jgi:hypothetical protein
MTWLHAVLDVPADQRASTAEFWGAVLGWPAGASWPGHPELCSFEPPTGEPYIHLQVVDRPPRVHLDIDVEDVHETGARAVALGATHVGEQRRWRTFLSPGGLPFCLVQATPRQAPGPVTWPGGHRSRMVQLCIDSPRAVHDAEVAFWRALLGDRFFPSGAPEFAGKWHDDAGSPLQLLFQRLEEDDGPVRAHLDHGADDVPAEVGRLLALGAEDVAAGRGRWHVLRDPAGLLFCVTGNSPEQTLQRDLD